MAFPASAYQVGDQTVHALDHVDLQVEAGEYISIMGPSGSGKSTLLNILGLLDRATAGAYRLAGTDVAELDDDALAHHRQAQVGFIFQSFHLISRLSALENVELPLVLAGAPVRQRLEQAGGVLEQVGLSPRAGHRPEQLSGGERQRVAIARAIVMQPRVLLADEPQPRNGLGRGNNEARRAPQRGRHRAARRDARSRHRRPRAPPPQDARRARRRGPEASSSVRLLDTGRLAGQSMLRYPLRTSMLLLAIAIGVAAVVALTAVGEGARRYVSGQFADLGTNLLIVVPGRADTAGAGGLGGLLMGETARDLTVGDAQAIARTPRVTRVAPIVVGSGTASWRARSREATVLGTSAAMRDVQGWELDTGRFLPELELDAAQPVCVLGHTMAAELFGSGDPLGEWLRIGDYRCRVLGVLAQAGLTGMFDTDELLVMPVAMAQQIFNTTGLLRIMVQTRSREAIPLARAGIERVVTARHQGQRDFTIIAQDAILSTFDQIFGVITAALAAIAGVSLLVAGILIMNVMLVAVSQRTPEVGLLKALGAKRRQIIGLFLTEAGFLSLLGALIGLGAGMAGTYALRRAFPIVDFQAPTWAVAAALGVAIASGLAFGIMPARRAAALDPVLALQRK